MQNRKEDVMNIKQKVLQIAEKEGYGLKETEGQNRGPAVRKYLKVCGFDTAEPWCAAFVSWVMNEALQERLKECFLISADTWAFRDFAEKNNILSTEPEQGDIFLSYNSQGPVHTGFVLSLPNNTQFKTCEGNSNTDGSSNGDGIYSNIRTVDNRYRFIKWHRLYKEEPEKNFELYLKDVKICDCVTIENQAYGPVRKILEFFGIKISKIDNKNKKIFL